MSSRPPLTEVECALCLADGQSFGSGWLLDRDSEVLWYQPPIPQHAVITRWLVTLMALVGLLFIATPAILLALDMPIPPSEPFGPLLRRLSPSIDTWAVPTALAAMGAGIAAFARFFWTRRDRAISMRLDATGLVAEEQYAGVTRRIHRHPWSAVRAIRTGGDGHSTTTYVWIDVDAATRKGRQSILVYMSESSALTNELARQLEQWWQKWTGTAAQLDAHQRP